MWPQLFTDSELETNKNYAWEYSMCILQLFTLSINSIREIVWR